jgi:hypothetical protein
MTAEQFTYWLQGYAELNASPPSVEQWQAIRDHLALVFTKVTPQRIGFPATPLQPTPQWQPPYEIRCQAGVISKRNGDHAMVTC